MKLPSDNILIDNFPYRVDLQEGEVMSPNVGLKIGASKLILLSQDQGDADFLDTFWHEVLHAIIAARGRSISLRSKDEEALIEALTPGLIQIFRDNPDWMKWTMKLGAEACCRRPKKLEEKETTHGR